MSSDDITDAFGHPNARPKVLPVAAGGSTSNEALRRQQKDAHDIIGLSTRLRIATWNCAGPSNLKMRSSEELGFDILGNFCTDVKLGNLLNKFRETNP